VVVKGSDPATVVVPIIVALNEIAVHSPSMSAGVAELLSSSPQEARIKMAKLKNRIDFNFFTIALFLMRLQYMKEIYNMYSCTHLAKTCILQAKFMKNYYSLLGIDTSATKDDVKKNYRLLATKFHPDKNSDPAAATKFIAITEAYDVLSNRKSRAQYDLARWQGLKQAKEARDTFETVVPPRVSLRTRRNEEQRIRGMAYQKLKGVTQKKIQLVVESSRIVSRYIFHILGLALFLVIGYSVLGNVPTALNNGLSDKIGICIYLMIIGGLLFLIIKSAILNFKKDIEAFSVFYKLTQLKATSYTLFILILSIVALWILSR